VKTQQTIIVTAALIAIVRAGHRDAKPGNAMTWWGILQNRDGIHAKHWRRSASVPA